MRILFRDIINTSYHVDRTPLQRQVSFNPETSFGNKTIQDKFESKLILGQIGNKGVFTTTLIDSSVDGLKANSSSSTFRDNNLIKALKNDYIKKFGEQKWQEGCNKAGGEENLFKLIRGFSANISAKKIEYAAWHNNNPNVTGTTDTNTDNSFSVQELGFDKKSSKAPQYCLPLAGEEIDIGGLIPPEADPNKDIPPDVETPRKAAATLDIKELLGDKKTYNFYSGENNFAIKGDKAFDPKDYTYIKSDGSTKQIIKRAPRWCGGKSIEKGPGTEMSFHLYSEISTWATVNFKCDPEGKNLTATVITSEGTYDCNTAEDLKKLCALFSHQDKEKKGPTDFLSSNNSSDLSSVISAYRYGGHSHPAPEKIANGRIDESFVTGTTLCWGKDNPPIIDALMLLLNL